MSDISKLLRIVEHNDSDCELRCGLVGSAKEGSPLYQRAREYHVGNERVDANYSFRQDTDKGRVDSLELNVKSSVTHDEKRGYADSCHVRLSFDYNNETGVYVPEASVHFRSYQDEFGHNLSFDENGGLDVKSTRYEVPDFRLKAQFIERVSRWGLPQDLPISVLYAVQETGFISALYRRVNYESTLKKIARVISSHRLSDENAIAIIGGYKPLVLR